MDLTLFLGKKTPPLLFLGGTTAETGWRDELIPILEKEKIEYFNPVVKNWNEKAIRREYQIKNNENTVELYVITKEMDGVFSIAEVVDASNKKPEKTIFMVIKDGFDESKLKSLNAVQELVEKNGAYIAENFSDIISKVKAL